MRKNGCRTSSRIKVAYEYAISREKEIEHSMTMKTNPFRPTNSPTSEKELIEPRGNGIHRTTRKRNPDGYPNSDRGRGFGRGRPFVPVENGINQSRRMKIFKGNQTKIATNAVDNSAPITYNPNRLRDKICSKCAKRGHIKKNADPQIELHAGVKRRSTGGRAGLRCTFCRKRPRCLRKFHFNRWLRRHSLRHFYYNGHLRSFQKNCIALKEDDLNSHIEKLKTTSENLFAIDDSGRAMSFFNEKTAR